jgi:hypothetical protein
MTIKEELIETLNKAVELMEFLEEDKDSSYDDSVMDIIIDYTIRLEKSK